MRFCVTRIIEALFGEECIVAMFDVKCNLVALLVRKKCCSVF